MKPTEQTILDPPEGNCFAACVASILEIPIEDVPNNHLDSDESWHSMQEWFSLRNLAMIGFIHGRMGSDAVMADTLRGYSICTISYETPRGALNHCVVAFNGQIAWNPHPLRDKVRHDSIVDWVVFRVLDPCRALTSDIRPLTSAL